jgi:hypothetical protein
MPATIARANAIPGSWRDTGTVVAYAPSFDSYSEIGRPNPLKLPSVTAQLSNAASDTLPSKIRAKGCSGNNWQIYWTRPSPRMTKFRITVSMNMAPLGSSYRRSYDDASSNFLWWVDVEYGNDTPVATSPSTPDGVGQVRTDRGTGKMTYFHHHSRDERDDGFPRTTVFLVNVCAYSDLLTFVLNPNTVSEPIAFSYKAEPTDPKKRLNVMDIERFIFKMVKNGVKNSKSAVGFVKGALSPLLKFISAATTGDFIHDAGMRITVFTTVRNPGDPDFTVYKAPLPFAMNSAVVDAMGFLDYIPF